MNEVRLGYYFARIKGSDRITTVGCWGERIQKEEDQDVEIIERVPLTVMKHSQNGVKILNLHRIMRGR